MRALADRVAAAEVRRHTTAGSGAVVDLSRDELDTLAAAIGDTPQIAGGRVYARLASDPAAVYSVPVSVLG